MPSYLRVEAIVAQAPEWVIYAPLAAAAASALAAFGTCYAAVSARRLAKAALLPSLQAQPSYDSNRNQHLFIENAGPGIAKQVGFYFVQVDGSAAIGGHIGRGAFLRSGKGVQVQTSLTVPVGEEQDAQGVVFCLDYADNMHAWNLSSRHKKVGRRQRERILSRSKKPKRFWQPARSRFEPGTLGESWMFDRFYSGIDHKDVFRPDSYQVTLLP